MLHTGIPFGYGETNKIYIPVASLVRFNRRTFPFAHEHHRFYTGFFR